MGARDAQRMNDTEALAAATREYAFAHADFVQVQQRIYELAGISLNDSKKNMVYSRLARRLRALGLPDFATYLRRLESDAAFIAAESQEFVNALTTNLTSFYREEHHFPILAQFARAELARTPGAAFRVWCAAASTGEEPYTIAMTLVEALGEGADVRQLATDIDTQVLQTAAAGVYRADSAARCGEARLRRFFLRGTAANAGKVRVRPDLARGIGFAPLNLLHADWSPLARFAPHVDVIFCRNVMIYFDRATQRRILERMAAVLRPGGLLFAGHSENFTDCREWFTLRGRTVYERLP